MKSKKVNSNYYNEIAYEERNSELQVEECKIPDVNYSDNIINVKELKKPFLNANEANLANRTF